MGPSLRGVLGTPHLVEIQLKVFPPPNSHSWHNVQN